MNFTKYRKENNTLYFNTEMQSTKSTMRNQTRIMTQKKQK